MGQVKVLLNQPRQMKSLKYWLSKRMILATAKKLTANQKVPQRIHPVKKTIQHQLCPKHLPLITTGQTPGARKEREKKILQKRRNQTVELMSMPLRPYRDFCDKKTNPYNLARLP